MGRKRMPGLVKRGKYWHIDKKIFGRRLTESTGAVTLQEAQVYLARRIEEIRQAKVFGVRQKHLFKEAATKYLQENQHKESIADDSDHLALLCRYIGNLTLENVHMGTLQEFIETRKKTVTRSGRTIRNKSINNALEVVRHILNLAASEWIDEYGMTWLHSASKIKLLPTHDSRKPYPLSWDEQNALFKELPEHLYDMALFKMNAGCRDKEVCCLRWDWESPVPELNTSVFIIPSHVLYEKKLESQVKNQEDRVVILNDVARSVIESRRGKHPDYVFTYRGKPIKHMNNSAWRRAREKAGLPQVRIHDLKHTFGRRLRSVGVNYEDRQDLLGHKSGN